MEIKQKKVGGEAKGYDKMIEDMMLRNRSNKVISPTVIKDLIGGVNPIPIRSQTMINEQNMYVIPFQRQETRKPMTNFSDLKKLAEELRANQERLRQKKMAEEEKKFSEVKDMSIPEVKLEGVPKVVMLGVPVLWSIHETEKLLEEVFDKIEIPTSILGLMDVMYAQYSTQADTSWALHDETFQRGFKGAYDSYRRINDQLTSALWPVRSDNRGMMIVPYEGQIEQEAYRNPVRRAEIMQYMYAGQIVRIGYPSTGVHLPLSIQIEGPNDVKFDMITSSMTEKQKREVVVRRACIRQLFNSGLMRRICRSLYDKVCPVYDFRMRNVWRYTIKRVWKMFKCLAKEGVLSVALNYNGDLEIEAVLKVMYQYCCVPMYFQGSRLYGMSGEIEICPQRQYDFRKVQDEQYDRWYLILSLLLGYVRPIDSIVISQVCKAWYMRLTQQTYVREQERGIREIYEAYLNEEQSCVHGSRTYIADGLFIDRIRTCESCKGAVRRYKRDNPDWESMLNLSSVFIMEHHYIEAVEELKKLFGDPERFYLKCIVSLATSSLLMVWPGVCYYLQVYGYEVPDWMNFYAKLYLSLVFREYMEEK